MNTLDEVIVIHLRRSHKVAIGIIFTLGTLVLIGWFFGVERFQAPLPRFGQMKVPAAFSFVVAGVSLWLWQQPDNMRRVRTAQLGGVVVALSGAAFTAMYLLGWIPGQRSWFTGGLPPEAITPTDFMALNTAVSFTLTGAAISLLRAKTRGRGRPAEWLAMAAAFFPLTSIIGYIYGSRPLTGELLHPFAPTTMAIHTALGLLTLCFAISTARPEQGWLARFASNSPEGVIARKLLPAGIVALLVLGGLCEIGKRLEYYRRKEEAALIVSSSALVFILLVRHSMSALSGLETRRREAEMHFRKSEEHLRMALEAARIGTWEWDFRSDKVWCSDAVKEVFGISGEVFDSRLESFLRLIHPDDRDMVRSRIRRLLDGTEDSYRVEYRICWPNGTIRYVAARGNIRLDEKGSPVCMAGTTMDVTERKLLERELIEASNREQRRLGQDLHDDLGQWLTAIHLEARALSMFLRPTSSLGAARAEKIVNWMGEALDRTRMLARGMAPAVIETGGLSAALEDLAVSTERMSRAICQYSCDDRFTIRNSEAALQLYRIAQEAISNALRHGNASQVAVRLERQINGLACLSIRDNGKGLPQPLPKSSGLGLRIMQYRAELLGADMEIRSEKEQGTEVICRFSGEL